MSAPLEDRLLGSRKAAAYLDVHPTTMAKWRMASKPGAIVGPAWTVTETGTIRYSLLELQRFAGIRREAA